MTSKFFRKRLADNYIGIISDKKIILGISPVTD